MKISRHLLLGLVILFICSCASSSGGHRAPINGWHKKAKKDAPSGYHLPKSKESPF